MTFTDPRTCGPLAQTIGLRRSAFTDRFLIDCLLVSRYNPYCALDTLAIFGDGQEMQYPGGKARVFPQLINLMPPHRVYIEPFLGGGSVMRHKRPAQMSVGVDLDPRPLARFPNYPASYTFMRADAVDSLVSLQPGADALVYCDPPYLASCRRSPRSPYRHSLDLVGHERLLTCLRGLPCAVMISSYACDLYEQVLSDWHRVTFRGTSHTGSRVEVVWLNFAPGGPLHDTRFLGENFRQREIIQRRQRRFANRLRKLPTPELQIALAEATAEFKARFGAEQFERWHNMIHEPSKTGDHLIHQLFLASSAREQINALPPRT